VRLRDEDYEIAFDQERGRVTFEGSLRLWHRQEYGKIRDFLLTAYAAEVPRLELDFTRLEFLNSSGISTLCEFILTARRLQRSPIVLIGSKSMLWQRRSLENLQKLWDRIEVRLENGEE
jgi:hypothetical protein